MHLKGALHTHSTCSDGTLSIAEVARERPGEAARRYSGKEGMEGVVGKGPLWLNAVSMLFNLAMLALGIAILAAAIFMLVQSPS